MAYRPIVIDTPGIGSEKFCASFGVQTDAEISEMLSSFLLQSHRVVIHAIGFVLKYSDSRVSLKREAQIKETLAMFPKWMMPNVVPILSSSDGTDTIPPPIRALFKNLGICENKVFFFNSGSLFDVSKG
uniref:G domain-containing protein n=1 Tax=Parascaris equorum TaxID=6256 RepID=A0A914RGX7_PAREQ